MAFVSGTQLDDIFIPTVNNATYLGGAGNDTYVITKAVAPGAVVVISDTEGSNRIQLTDGLAVVTSQFAANAVELTLSNGARVQLLGAASFGFDIGANVTSGDTSATPNQSYAQFASAFGVSQLPTGTGIVSGVPNYIVFNGGGYLQPTFAVTASSAASEGGAVTFSVGLTGRIPGQSYSVNVALTGSGGAVAGTDFESTLRLDSTAINAGVQLANGTLMIPASSTLTNVTLGSGVLTDDISPETGEGATFTLSAPSAGAYLSPTQSSATVQIVDVPARTYTLSPLAPSVFEGQPITFTVTASAPVAIDTSVTFTVRAPDAQGPNTGTGFTNSADFAASTLIPTTVTIPAGKASTSFTVTALDDAITELPEDYKLVAEINGGPTFATPVTVLDRAIAPNFTLSAATEAEAASSFAINAVGDLAPVSATMHIDLAGQGTASRATIDAVQISWP